MAADDLVRMANQIANFFAPYPEADAIEGIRDHLAKFWTPAMRRELRTIVERASPGANVVHQLVLRALEQPAAHKT